MNSGWSKGAAGLAALLLAGAGASSFVGAEKRDERGTGYRAADARTAGASDAATPRRPVVASSKHRATSELVAARPAGASERAGVGTRVDGGEKDGSAGTNGGAPDSGGGADPVDGVTPSVPALSQDAPAAEVPDAPSVDAPVSVPGVQETVDSVSGTLPDLDPTVEAVAPELPVDVPDPAQVVPEVTAPVTGAVDDAVATSSIPE